ncbi:TrkH family potassium uptake protein [Ketobacter sp.]|uniref:TrkH family potassium uptake protein n=1 Tax=Ketobacter sp. TaxID=2083498 RepID=UPI000F0E62CE|nr:TrkH family potassium uptake protein [Ketobacter sp.]RLT99246.1 MAG: potassium transporter [Ketobacter sp.]
MHPAVILRILGLLLMVYSSTMLLPALVALIYNDGGAQQFIYAFAITLVAGLLCWLPVQNRKQDLRVRDGFVVVVLFWTVLGLFGAIPFMLGDEPHMDVADAVFESISGLTTTGATVISGIDALPKSILFYRQQLQWLGGMGIIVLAVAILPMLGVGGMQLYRAEAPGPVKDNKLTPRITETAKALWYIYVSLTLACALAYWLCGMSVFDAISHSFSTVAIGGFSTHDASIGYFQSTSIELVTVLFMLLAGVNFGLHFLAWRRRNVFSYFQDPEFRFYITVLLSISLLVFVGLLLTNEYSDPLLAARHALFETVSIGTTTGYGVADFSAWHPLLATALIMGSFVGACAASTGGGIKAIRVYLMFKQGLREIRRLIHPNAVMIIKLSNKAVPDRVIEAVWGFFGIYLISFCVLFLAMLATGLDFISGFSAVAACLNNLGPGIGTVSVHYGEISDTAKWILCFAMLLGRLEIFTLLVLFTPMFWRH